MSTVNHVTKVTVAKAVQQSAVTVAAQVQQPLVATQQIVSADIAYHRAVLKSAREEGEPTPVGSLEALRALGTGGQ